MLGPLLDCEAWNCEERERGLPLRVGRGRGKEEGQRGFVEEEDEMEWRREQGVSARAGQPPAPTRLGARGRPKLIRSRCRLQEAQTSRRMHDELETSSLVASRLPVDLSPSSTRTAPSARRSTWASPASEGKMIATGGKLHRTQPVHPPPRYCEGRKARRALGPTSDQPARQNSGLRAHH